MGTVCSVLSSIVPSFRLPIAGPFSKPSLQTEFVWHEATSERHSWLSNRILKQRSPLAYGKSTERRANAKPERFPWLLLYVADAAQHLNVLVLERAS